MSPRASPSDSGPRTPIRGGDPMDVANSPNVRDSSVPAYDSRGQVIARNTRGSPIVTPLGARHTRFGSTPPRAVTPNSPRQLWVDSGDDEVDVRIPFGRIGNRRVEDEYDEAYEPRSKGKGRARKR